MGGKKEKTDETKGNKARKMKKAMQKLVGPETEVRGITVLGHNLWSLSTSTAEMGLAKEGFRYEITIPVCC